MGARGPATVVEYGPDQATNVWYFRPSGTSPEILMGIAAVITPLIRSADHRRGSYARPGKVQPKASLIMGPPSSPRRTGATLAQRFFRLTQAAVGDITRAGECRKPWNGKSAAAVYRMELTSGVTTHRTFPPLRNGSPRVCDCVNSAVARRPAAPSPHGRAPPPDPAAPGRRRGRHRG